ncbi:MAG: hypothetical protein AB7J13_00665 [Pyrinomonadaceae bacterium]
MKVSENKVLENITGAKLATFFAGSVILFTIFVIFGALLRNYSVETIISRLLSFDLIVSIFLVTISSFFWFKLRYQIFWLVVSVVPSLVWQEVGFPVILVTPFEKFSWIPASITLAMTILFWSLEKLVLEQESPDSDEMITLSLKDDKRVARSHTQESGH